MSQYRNHQSFFMTYYVVDNKEIDRYKKPTMRRHIKDRHGLGASAGISPRGEIPRRHPSNSRVY